MTNLQETLQSLLHSRNPIIPDVELPEFLAIDKAYKEVSAILGDGPPIEPPKDPETWVKLAQKVKAEGNWGGLGRRELKNIGLCLWYGEKPLAEDDAFLNSFFAACTDCLRKSLWLGLRWVYLYNYADQKAGISILGNWLASTVNEWSWPWAERQKNLSLFNGSAAPGRIAEAIFNVNQEVGFILESCGLGTNLQFAGMSCAAFQAGLKEFESVAKREGADKVYEVLQRILKWAVLEKKAFSYPVLTKVFIESLLLPWRDDKPDAKIKDAIQSFLIEHFGDPRIEKRNDSNKWKSVGDGAIQVIYSWLVERALEQFLDVVDELAVDHQWRYRRAFWMAYYKRNVIKDAWVAFATKGADHANRIATRNSDESWRRFGRLRGSGDSKHAVLVLRIGDLVIVDFSHNGACRIWKARDPEKAPKPYEGIYDREDLIHGKYNHYGRADFEVSHDYSQGYLWQRKIAEIIKDEAQIKISPMEYQP